MAGRERDLERLLTFVDAVVAIAITLLVLPLTEIGGRIQGGSVADLLRDHTNELLGFFLSFTVIARLWLTQHSVVSSLVRQNGAVIRLLLAWTLTIVFLPFATVLVTGTHDDALAEVLYLGTMAVSSALLALIARAVARDRSLRDTDERPDALRTFFTTITFLVALAVSVALPATGYWPLLLLLLVDPVVHRIRRTRPVGGRTGR